MPGRGAPYRKLALQLGSLACATPGAPRAWGQRPELLVRELRQRGRVEKKPPFEGGLGGRTLNPKREWAGWAAGHGQRTRAHKASTPNLSKEGVEACARLLPEGATP